MSARRGMRGLCVGVLSAALGALPACGGSMPNAMDASMQAQMLEAGKKVVEVIAREVTKQAYEDALRRSKPISSETKRKRAKRAFDALLVASRLAHANLPESIQLGLIQGEANATAYGDYGIIVTEGLLDLLGKDKALLTAALAHELGHVVHAHAMQNVLANSALILALAAEAPRWKDGVPPPKVRARVAEALNLYGEFRREQELEADRAGMGLVYNVGYAPASSVKLLEKMLQAGEGIDLVHPPLAQRIETLEPLLSRYALCKLGG